MVQTAGEAAVMRKRKPHFEQVPIEVAEKVLLQAAAPSGVPPPSPQVLSVLEPEAASEFPRRAAKRGSKKR
jgi:hypothetical protein